MAAMRMRQSLAQIEEEFLEEMQERAGAGRAAGPSRRAADPDPPA